MANPRYPNPSSRHYRNQHFCPLLFEHSHQNPTHYINHYHYETKSSYTKPNNQYDRSSLPTNPNPNKVYFENFPNSYDAPEMKRIFSKYGISGCVGICAILILVLLVWMELCQFMRRYTR